ncbi:MAG: dipeptidase [Elusimicrobia bacterium]|nr:dipeptidase [Elusimicrobiota bacterium]
MSSKVVEPRSAASTGGPINEYVGTNFGRFLDELIAWLKIPSISALSQHKGDVLQSVDFADGLLKEMGFRTEVWPTKGHPSLFAEKMTDDSKPTVLIYGHLDVQPVDPLKLWKKPPFEPWQEGDRLYGRGTADDKGQTMMHIKACQAILNTRGRLPVNVKFIIEGEEEIGSPNFETLVNEHREQLSNDAVVISDTAMVGENCPTISYATRGLVYFDLIVQGPQIDLHSGGFGGAVANPALALAKILSAMTDAKGRVTIPGFYNNVAKLSKEEQRWFKRARFMAKELEAAAGVPLTGGEKGLDPITRVWARPTFEVHGLVGGFLNEEGSKTIIPSSARAKVSMRLVPKQNPDQVAKSFERYVAKLAPKGLRVTVRRLEGGGPAFLENVNSPAMEAARKALHEVFGVEPYWERCGGSIFAPDLFKKAFPKTPVIMLGFGLPGENAHAPNEWLDLKNFKRGILTAARFYELLGRANRN